MQPLIGNTTCYTPCCSEEFYSPNSVEVAECVSLIGCSAFLAVLFGAGGLESCVTLFRLV